MRGKLIYFDLGGRAEGIRAMLAHANFDYEDARISMEEFARLKRDKTALPLGSLPIWQEDGFTQAQSSSILRQLGMRLGYYHEDPMVCWKIDSIIDYMEDKQGAHVAIYAPLLGGAAFDESMAGEWFTKFWDVVIPVLDARLVERGGDCAEVVEALGPERQMIDHHETISIAIERDTDLRLHAGHRQLQQLGRG